MNKALSKLDPAVIDGMTQFLNSVGLSVVPTDSLAEQAPLDMVFHSLKDAVAAYPDLYRSVDSIRWRLRNRQHNGLMEFGAVIEVWNNPDQKRPSLAINHRKWVEWYRANEADIRVNTAA